jgi:hypothetical protein
MPNKEFNYERYMLNNPLMKEAGDYEYTSAEDFDLKPQEGPNDPLGPDVSKTPRADFQDAIYAANKSGLYKEELIILVNQNSK